METNGKGRGRGGAFGIRDFRAYISIFFSFLVYFKTLEKGQFLEVYLDILRVYKFVLQKIDISCVMYKKNKLCDRKKFTRLFFFT